MVIVNDGSSDNTQKLTEQFIFDHHLSQQFTLINLEKSDHEPGAKVVRSFYKGLDSVQHQPYDCVCKFDADIIFPRNYLEEIHQVYIKNPKAGMVSGLVSIVKNGKWEFENLSNKNHVRGPIKSYRKECFLKMGGLRPVLGWDNIDVMLARMYGFEVITLKNLWVKHLRPTAYQYQSKKAEKLGLYFYNIGLSFPLAFISSLKSSWKSKSFSEFFITIKTYLNQSSPRVLSAEEIQFIRKFRWKEMFSKLKRS